MKSLFFDSGPIISLTTNGLLWILPELKKRFGGEFFITDDVRKELVVRPLEIKRFEFEAVQVSRFIDDGVLSVVESENVSNMVRLANECFSYKGKSIKVAQDAEIEILALAKSKGCAAVIDERTVRLLVEDPRNLELLLRKRLNCPVEMNLKIVREFQSFVKDVPIIRSAELVGVAFKIGILDSLVPKMANARVRLLDAALWGLKYGGCAITSEEIEELKSELS